MNGKQTMHLVQTKGHVLSPAEFVARHDILLSDGEGEFLHRSAAFLNQPSCAPKVLDAPWVAAAEQRAGRDPVIVARKSGARSAIWEEASVQFKGCCPADGSLDFPSESLPFGASAITYTRIPFGVMTADAVMRELLGYCFCRHHAIPCATAPMCVYAYPSALTGEQYCLVLRVTKGIRAESFLQLRGIPVSSLTGPSPETEGCLVGSEVTLAGLNSRWYSEQKARWLASMHFCGGFRGLLNNNIGNDVIEIGRDGKTRFLFCDFDTFRLIDISAVPSRQFLDAFAMQCLVEVVKGSLPILQFIAAPTGSPEREVAVRIAAVYRRKSSLWNAYCEKAHPRAHELGWDWRALETGFDRAFESSAFVDASCSVLLTEHALKRYRRTDRWDYVPHEAE